MTFKVGDRVYWNDPDPDGNDGPGVIVCVHGEGEDMFFGIEMDDGGCVEAPGHELERTTKYRVSCDQCEMLSINGLACHETGCVNSKKIWDVNERYWVNPREEE